MLAADQLALFRHLHGWDLRLAAPGQSLPRWDVGRIQRPSTRSGLAADPTGGDTGMLGDPVLALVVRLLGLLVALAMIVRNARRR